MPFRRKLSIVAVVTLPKLKLSQMQDLNRRLDGLETTLAPVGKPFIIWVMIDGRRMTSAEIDAAFHEALGRGGASPGDKPLAIS